MKLALASTSPRRRALLEEAGIAFSAVDPGLDDAREEELARGWRALGYSPARISERLAVAKALASERRVPPGTSTVLAADTVVILGDEALGKPRDEAHARAMIERLSGKTHEVVTGVALLDLATGRLEVGSESTRVRFRALDAAATGRFVASGAWSGKAGAYGVQDDAAAPLVEKVEGSRSNVIGLPLERVKALLASQGGSAGASLDDRSKSLGFTAKVAVVAVAVGLLGGCPPGNSSSTSPSPTGSSTPTAAPKLNMGTPVPPEQLPRTERGTPQTGLPERILEINGKKIKVELATTYEQRQMGLMWRPTMPDDNGMLFIYSENEKKIHSFWMHNTLIPLTVAYIDDDGAIVDLIDMKARDDTSHPSSRPIRLVLEMNQGWFLIHGVKEGAIVKGAPETLPLGE